MVDYLLFGIMDIYSKLVNAGVRTVLSFCDNILSSILRLFYEILITQIVHNIPNIKLFTPGKSEAPSMNSYHILNCMTKCEFLYTS